MSKFANERHAGSPSVVLRKVCSEVYSIQSRMQRLSSTQREKVTKFISLTQADEKTSINCLASNDWKLQIALDNFYEYPERYISSGGGSGSSRGGGGGGGNSGYRSNIDMKKADALFNRFLAMDGREKEPDKLQMKAIEGLLNELGLDPVSREVLLFAWKCQAKKQCVFTKEEFLKGLSDLGADNIDELKKRLKAAENELSFPENFRKLYLWTFSYGTPPEQKNLDLESAIAYWQIVFGSSRYPHLDLWFEFLQKTAQRKAISRDTWNLFLDFVETVNLDFANYDSDGAWPVVIDEFVDFAKSRLDNSMQVA